MKLATYSHLGTAPRVCVIIEDSHGPSVIDLAAASASYRQTQPLGGFLLPADMTEFLQTGERGLSLAREVISWATKSGFPKTRLDDIQLAAPVPNPPKILALAGNYQEHILEGGGAAVDKSKVVPMLFIKPRTTLAGNGDKLVLPTNVSNEVDWELELAVIIGRPAKSVPVSEALDYVAGYSIFNDVSSRSLELTKKRQETRPRDAFFDWLNGKWQDGFSLMGPFLVTKDEVPSPQELSLRLFVNDQIQQDGSSKQMIFSVAETIAWASELMTLEPGDVIATGTPAGVGSAKGVYLKAGDELHGEIQGLGSLVNSVTE
jgi:2-keto-4-pentenoate hydratase/2-oxohepta-3-ene-1,7-dioic acid hydratase in catechol pathway